MRWIVVALCLLAGVAHAGPNDRAAKEAIKRFEKANALYDVGKYEEALFLYQAAYELLPSPTFLFNRGLAKEKTLDYEGCALDFEQYLRDGGEEAADARTRADSCRARVRMKVTITTVPAGVRVSRLVDGEPLFLGRTPATIELAPGPYDLALELEGYVGMTGHFEVEIGKPQGYDFQLEKLSKLTIDAGGVAGAQISIDGEPAEPAPIERVVRAGSYRVHVTAPGHTDDDRMVSVDAGRDVQLSIALQVPPTKQRLRVRSLAPAAILIDGEVPDDTDLAAGVHVVEAHADGRVPFRGQIVLPAGKDVEAVVTLPRERSTLQRALLWSGASAAVGFAIGGGIYGALALDAEAEYAGPTPSVETRDNGLTFRFAADVLLGTAVVVGTVTAIAWWLTRPDDATLEVQR